jgi:hypothetical protein
MTAPLTVVIPTLNAGDHLTATASALFAGVTAGLVRGLVVSDGGSTDATLALADALGARVVGGPPGRGAQIARGVAAAGTDWVLILHADTHLAPRWPAAAADHMRRYPDDAGAFRLAFRAGGMAPRLVAGWANLRSRAGLPYGDQGLLVRRTVLASVGGVPEIPLMEDVVLARALRGRLRRINATAFTGAERYLAGGWVRCGARNLWTLARYLAGTDPERLARDYDRRR